MPPSTSASGNANTNTNNNQGPPLPGQEEPLKRLAKVITSFLSRPDSGPFREPVDWRGLELYDYPEICPIPMDLGTVQRSLDRSRYLSTAIAVADIRLVWKNCMTYNAVGSDFWLLAKAYSKRFEDRYRKIKNEFDVGPEPTAQSESEEGAEDDNDEEGGDEEDDDNGDEEGEDEEEDDDDDEEEEAEFEDDGDDVVASKKSGRSSAVTGSPNSSTFAATALDARAKLAANLLLLTGPELGHVVSRLEQLCPAALEILPKDSTLAGAGGVSSNARPNTAIPGKMEIVLDLIDAPLLKELSDYSVKATAQRKRGRAAAEAEKAANAANTKEKHTAAVAAAAAAAAAAAGTGSTENTASASGPGQASPQVPGTQQGGPDAATGSAVEIDDTNKRKRKK